MGSNVRRHYEAPLLRVSPEGGAAQPTLLQRKRRRAQLAPHV
jgi:hypothetical protein